MRQKEKNNPMKRAKNLYAELISDENLKMAILEVNRTHRWRPHHRPNKVVVWVDSDIPQRIIDLRNIIEQGFVPAPAALKRRWDKSAGKWRDIHEPRLWPDQYIHHALVQVLQPVMMRGMDRWCCGSIRGRGIHYGMDAVKKWMRNDPKGTKYCAELDIHHFYDSLKPEVVFARMKQLVKDNRVLDLVWRVIKDGILIGAYFSQWFANVVLQPLDHLIREGGFRVSHYMRYMDNFTIFSLNKRSLKKLIAAISNWLAGLGLKLKDTWQHFATAVRLPTALGYRYGHGYTLLRKRNLFRLKRQLLCYYRKLKRGAVIPYTMALGLLSRLGQLKHCNSVRLYARLVRGRLQRDLKNIVRAYARKERAKWNTSSAMCSATA